MSLVEVLVKYYKLYPGMQIQDMVKLIYQNEFAGGHLILNKADSLKRLQEEYHSLKWYSSNHKIQEYILFEDIGNNLHRINLRALKTIDINLATINSFFVNTANSVSGSIQRFEEKLELLKQCCKRGELPYPITEIENYLMEYKNKGYPVVSHSEIYRSSYFPAYRIIKSEYCNFFDIFCRIDSLMKSKDTVNVAIDGNSGSGKSTLASIIGNVYDCNVFHMDDFFLTPDLRTEERLKETGGNVDYVRFKNEVLNGINSGTKFQYRKYDCKQGALWGETNVVPKQLNIIEGSYSMHPTLIESYDLKVFLHINEEKQSQRILERNGIKLHKMFIDLWIPLENKYFEGMKIKEQCDLVYDM